MGTTTGQVTLWEPPSRFVHSGSGGTGAPLAYVWQVEAREGGTCLVRLVTSGFLSEADWQAEYDSTSEGWQLFLNNLRLYLTHFPGQRCTSMHGAAPVRRLARRRLARAHDLARSAAGAERGAGGERVVTDRHWPGASSASRSGLMTLAAGGARAGRRGDRDRILWRQGVSDALPLSLRCRAEAVVARDAPAWNAWLERTFTFAEPDPEPPSA